MAELEIRNLHVRAGEQEILKGLDLTVGKGEIHALMGPNGSGKSTLANVVMGHPNLEVTEGQVIFKGEDITEADTDERARMGLFMAFQYPVAVPGVTVTKYLRTVINAHREAHGEEPISLKDFRQTVEAAMRLTEVPREFSARYLNEGFSGGEKKRMEILQLALQKPEMAILDETDSGLDIDALRDRLQRRQRRRRRPHGRADHHPLPAHPPPRAAEPRARHVPGPDRQGGRPRARRRARGEGLRLDQGRGRGARHDRCRHGRPRLDVAAVAAQFPILQREIDGRPLVYLDSGATAQKPEVVLRELDASYRLHNANIHRGVYTLAQEATERFEGARERIARFIGAPTAETIFTKNVTEAINLVAYAWGRSNVRAGDVIVLTPMEHHANIVPWQQLAQEKGARLAYVELTDDGRLDMDSLRRAARARPEARRRHARLERARHAATRSRRSWRERTARVRSCWSTGRRRSRTCASTCARSAPTSTASPATRSTGRRASACCTGGASCSRRCRRS